MRRYRSFASDSARWDGFELRDDDIIISTPSKCGTTWTQMLCALLIFQTSDLPAPLTDLSPWLDVLTATRDDVVAALDAQTHRRFIKTHTPLDGLPFDERVTYITVGRDPRDAALSWDNHLHNMNLTVLFGARAEAVGLDDLGEVMPDGPPVPSPDPVERFWQWIENPGVDDFAGLAGLLHHLDTFWQERARPNVALFHYADLTADLDGEMRRLADILRINVADDVWPSLVEAATFARMRDRADKLAPQVSVDGFWNDATRFFNKGTSGQWHDFFGPDDQARYDARIATLAPPDLAAWVHTGSKGA